MFHTEYVICDPERPLLESQLQLTALHAFLDSARGRRFPQGELKARAVGLDADSAQALEEPLGAPALCLEHLFRGAVGIADEGTYRRGLKEMRHWMKKPSWPP